MKAAPVITIDGPAAAGKGTVAAAVAAATGFHCLDSGKLYRAAALAAREWRLPPPAAAARLAGDAARLAEWLASPLLAGGDIAQAASKLAADAGARRALIAPQRAMRRPPGLIADGRDMGSVVFPDAAVKIYLTADAETRARRRCAQLARQGIHATMTDILAGIRQRDKRDLTRLDAPLTCPPDALTLDSTQNSVGDIAQAILQKARDAAVFSPTPPANPRGQTTQNP